ncbi:MAG: hypothetical protein OQL09_06175 [Gammaproteobacteria bacterium]|nr:hypothetical protein [Gammaproteobacteria bacterium]
MRLIKRVKFFLNITSTHEILRRYFVVNGFDGALTMLGLIMGFLLSDSENISTIINACLGAAIALGVSGVSSAYVSESAERRRALAELEAAMVSDLQQTAHGDATKWVPMLIALVNGMAPFSISLLILTPLLLVNAGVAIAIAPLHAAIIIAVILIFLLGVFLGRISDVSWLRSGLQTLIVALLTLILIYLFAGT